jgi:hypothetical protein
MREAAGADNLRHGGFFNDAPSNLHIRFLIYATLRI